MADARLRHAIAFEAARLMYDRTESEYFTAKRKAAKRVCRQQVQPNELPSNREIRDLIQVFVRLHEGEHQSEPLRSMRLAALRLMRQLRQFKPRLIGSVLTGHIRKGSDIDLHLFSDSVEPITHRLEGEGYAFEVERKQVTKQHETRLYTHIHVHEKFAFELTVYRENQAHYVFRSSITGKAIERVSIRELEELLEREDPDLDLLQQNEEDLPIDPYPLFRLLLLALDGVKQSPKYHPEGDALSHSLQVFERAREVRPYDEEFLLAALLHDVGKAIDPADHVNASLQALHGLLSERTAFLIAHHMEAQAYQAGTLGQRRRQRLESAEDFEDLLFLRELDDAGREPGALVPSVDEVLDYLRELERSNRW